MGIEGAMDQLISQGLEGLPELMFAVVLLVVGLFVGWLLQFIAERILRSLGLDGFAERSGMARTLKQTSKMDITLSQAIGRIVFWTVFLIFLAAALQAVGLEEISLFITAFARFLPRVLGAVLLAVGGFFGGKLVRDLITEDKDRREVPEAWEQLGQGAQVAVVGTAILLALTLLGIELTPLLWLLVVLSAVVGIIVAVGWGPLLRTRSQDLLIARRLRKEINDGDLVRVGELEGFVAKIGDMHLTLQTTEGMVHVPNALLANQPLAVITTLAESDLQAFEMP